MTHCVSVVSQVKEGHDGEVAGEKRANGRRGEARRGGRTSFPVRGHAS